jgi:hypothetical protein
VLARKLALPKAETVYVLWFLHEELTLDDAPDFYIEGDTLDDFHLDGTGGLIDYITAPLAIEWTTDPKAFDEAAARFPGSEKWTS